MAPMLIIFGGLPGTGKTEIARELARRLGAVHLRIDSIEQAIRDFGGLARPLDDAGYRVAYAVAADNLRIGHTVVADSVNPLSITRDAWIDVARRACVPAVEVEVLCSDEAEHRRRVESRVTDIPGLALPDWERVLSREYHPWTRDHIVLDTAGRSVDECVRWIMEVLRAAVTGDQYVNACESARIPEKNKVPGVCYAVTVDGLELPVIDITHPAFACDVSPQELSAIIDDSVRAWEAVQTTPPEVVRAYAANSLLVRGWVQSVGTFMSGVMTYLYRLGPSNLGDGYAGPVDRRTAAGIMPLSFRFRLRDVARLIADGLAPALAARPGRPVHLLNIAGGPAADSINALILLNKEHPEWVRGRPIAIQVLDLDRDGPRFGARALAALLPDGAPLAGLTASLDAVEYNWADASRLRPVMDRIEPGAAAVGSSEGGLFDYGSDEQIVANLAALRDGTPADFVMVGSVVRDLNTLDPRLRASAQPGGRPLIRYLGMDAFRPLAQQAGWVVDRVIDSVAHHAVSLRKA